MVDGRPANRNCEPLVVAFLVHDQCFEGVKDAFCVVGASIPLNMVAEGKFKQQSVSKNDCKRAEKIIYNNNNNNITIIIIKTKETALKVVACSPAQS